MTDGTPPPPLPIGADFDEENRLRPQFVREVLDLAEAGDVEGARERVGRLPTSPTCSNSRRPMAACCLPPRWASWFPLMCWRK
jgi:hypothetical protein